MNEIYSIEKMRNIIKQEAFVLFYLSREACGICHAVKPKIIELCEQYPDLKTFYVDLDKNEVIAGQYSIFTIPGILVFAEGKEAIREARHFSMQEIGQQLTKLSRLLS
jgi:thioredoxin-like negative regulator of GroEL